MLSTSKAGHVYVDLVLNLARRKHTFCMYTNILHLRDLAYLWYDVSQSVSTGLIAYLGCNIVEPVEWNEFNGKFSLQSYNHNDLRNPNEKEIGRAHV